MAITANNTTLTFNDATTQTTSAVTAVNVSTGISSSGGKTPTLTNTGVTSATAGTGISVSASTGGVTIGNTGVTSVAAGTGISVSAGTGGVTITNTAPAGSVPSYNSVGSYAWVRLEGNCVAINPNQTAAAGLSANQVSAQNTGGGNTISGTWRWMGFYGGSGGFGVGLRIS